MNNSQKKFLAKLDWLFILLLAVNLASLFLFEGIVTTWIVVIIFVLSLIIVVYSRIKYKQLDKD